MCADTRDARSRNLACSTFVSYPKGRQAPRLAEAVPLAGEAAARKPPLQAPAAPVPAIAALQRGPRQEEG